MIFGECPVQVSLLLLSDEELLFLPMAAADFLFGTTTDGGPGLEVVFPKSFMLFCLVVLLTFTLAGSLPESVIFGLGTSSFFTETRLGSTAGPPMGLMFSVLLILPNPSLDDSIGQFFLF